LGPFAIALLSRPAYFFAVAFFLPGIARDGPREPILVTSDHSSHRRSELWARRVPRT